MINITNYDYVSLLIVQFTKTFVTSTFQSISASYIHVNNKIFSAVKLDFVVCTIGYISF